ncbi:MAG TPA: cytochrome c oxidase subunit II, partial [Candidatus Limnocylindrales bacterium]|nr:cytochrome c oxidase subunit II [Candidatus Limnocylindrales bacterium]
MNDPAGAVAREIVPVYWIMFALAVIVLAIVDGALIYSGIKFRERPGHVAKQFHGHNLLELTWTVVPTAMVIFLAVISFQKLLYINDDSGADMTVKVEGRQWTFVYTYPDEPLFQTRESGPLQGAEELHIPVNTKVKLELSA